jgi:rhomboid protease GluP
MCPNCRAFVTTDDRVCPYCGIQLGKPAVERRAPSDLLGGLIPHAHFTTIVILLINLGFFAASELGDRYLTIAGLKDRNAILQGQWYRLVTAGFFHGGVMHIFFNSWALLSVGSEVETIFGTARFLVFYFVANVCGFLASMYWTPNPSLGASAALFGLIGVMVALGTMAKSSMGDAIRSHYLTWAGYGFIMAVLMPGIDNAAHVGGFIGGFGAAWLAGMPGRILPSWRDNLWRALAVICGILTLLAFAQMFNFYFYLKRMQQ